MLTTLTRTTFVTALATALLGGVALIAWQGAGLVAGSGSTVTEPNGTFKTVICVAASVAAIAAYLLTHVLPGARSAGEEQ